MVPSRTLSIAIFLCCLGIAAQAELRPPSKQVRADSLSAKLDQGVEYKRLTNYFGSSLQLPSRWLLTVHGRWRTDWQRQRSSTNRIRQDGNWYGGVERPLHAKLKLWAAGEGEHFDDRPVAKHLNAAVDAQLVPRKPAVETTIFVPGTESASATRILRGGAGLSYRPWTPLTIHSAAGIVDDKRIGQQESGFGVWTLMDLERWMTSGFRHDGSLNFKSETPVNHYSFDLAGNYRLFREFFPGNTNRLDLKAGLIERDVYRGASLPASRRMERTFAVRDELGYEIAENVSVAMTGDLSQEITDLGEGGDAQSELKEQQAGVSAALQSKYRKSVGQAKLSVHSVSQTIRGEILSGRKTEAAFLGATVLPDRSTLALRLAVAKYVLDTRSDRNYDDRDELGYRIESKWTRKLFGALFYEARALVHLNHLVYIFKENSANNRWTRFLLAGSRLVHTPAPWFAQELTFTVSANYQAYDFEFNPRSTRSTVFRRFIAGDSVAVHLNRSFALLTDFELQIEELGRLYWEEFEEARSDETQSTHIASLFVREWNRDYHVGAGYMWDRRRGDTFADGTNARQRFLDLNSYGPIARISHLPASGLFLFGQGRALRQFELHTAGRWIVSGELTGGYRW